MGLMAKKLGKKRQKPAPKVEPEAPKVNKAGVAASIKAISAVGVIAAALLGVTLNVLVARFYKRWDWTSTGLYTLSTATLDTLHGLNEPVEVIIFLSASDPMTLSVRHMLEAYGAETTKLSARYVDPDRSPAEFLALQQKYQILSGKTEDGRVVTDASLVIARGDRHWFVTNDDMVSWDENDGQARPKLEQALTEGLRNVLTVGSVKLCFTSGHQEISIEDGGPNGIAELRFRLQKNNYEVVALDLSSPQLPKLDECRVVALIGPEVKFSQKAAEHVATYLQGGGNVLILTNPILDEENRIQPSGLEPVCRVAGVELQNDFIIEKNEQARLPQGLGETFFTTPKPHAVTNGLFKDDQPRFKVLASAAQSLKPKGDGAVPLLVTSDEAFSLHDVRPFVEQGKPVEKGENDPKGPFTIAFATELPKASSSNAPHGPRALIAGSANLAWSRNWRDPTLLGNRLFLESAVSWLAARPALVSVPEKPEHDAGLGLSEDSMSEVLRYVLIYMPGAAIALGVFVTMRRRGKEKRSRADAEKKRDASEAEERNEPENSADSEGTEGSPESKDRE
jgi:hypothetical protein